MEKICKECKHYLREAWVEPVCGHPRHVILNLISGEKTAPSCKMMRYGTEREAACGLNGVLYETRVTTSRATNG